MLFVAHHEKMKNDHHRLLSKVVKGIIKEMGNYQGLKFKENRSNIQRIAKHRSSMADAQSKIYIFESRQCIGILSISNVSQ